MRGREENNAEGGITPTGYNDDEEGNDTVCQFLLLRGHSNNMLRLIRGEGRV